MTLLPAQRAKLARGGFSAYLLLIVSSTVFLLGCAQLTDKACLSSASHNLVLGQQGYNCIRASNECEADFPQDSSTSQTCEQSADCEYLPGICYCPPEVYCICGGGPPAMCVSQSDDRDYIRRHRSMLDGNP